MGEEEEEEENSGRWCCVVPWFFPRDAAKNYRLVRMRKSKIYGKYTLEGDGFTKEGYIPVEFRSRIDKIVHPKERAGFPVLNAVIKQSWEGLFICGF